MAALVLAVFLSRQNPRVQAVPLKSTDNGNNRTGQGNRQRPLDSVGGKRKEKETKRHGNDKKAQDDKRQRASDVAAAADKVWYYNVTTLEVRKVHQEHQEQQDQQEQH